MRFHLRWSGTVGRWIAPGPKTSGMSAAISARTIERIPVMPAPASGSSARLSTISASSRSPTSAAGTSGSPYPAGPSTRSKGAWARSASTSGAGSAPSSADGKLSSSSGCPPSSAQTLEGDGAGIDAGDARARGQTSSSFAIS